MSSIAAQSPVGYVRQIWGYRNFWLTLVRMDLRKRYKNSVLGIGWSLIQPLAMATILCFMFYKVFNVELQFYAGFLLSGLLMWNFISSSILEGCESITNNESYIRSYRLPLAIYPLRAVVSVSFHFSLLFFLTLIAIWFFRGFENLAVLYVMVPILIGLFVLGYSISVIFGILNVLFPDIKHLSTIALQFLFYITPVLYPPEVVAHRGYVTMVITYNPLTYLLNLVREPLMYARVPSGPTLCVSSACIVISAVLAMILLRRNERDLIYRF